MQEDRPILERDIQSYLEANLQSLGEPLFLVGKERAVSFGRIDLLAKDTKNRLVAIELKLGPATRDAVGQLQSYIGALRAEEPNVFVRGILVAACLDASGEAAFRVTRDIKFVSYSIAFAFHEVLAGESTYDAWLDQSLSKSKTPAGSSIWLPPGFKRLNDSA